MTLGSRANLAIDGVLFVVVLFVVGIGLLVIYNMNLDLEEAITEDDTLTATETKYLTEPVDQFPSFWDSVFVFLFGAAYIGMIIGAFLIDSHPVFLVVSILILLFAVLVPMAITNAYEETVTDGYADIVGNFPMMNYILTHLLETFIVVVATAMIALYAKSEWIG